MNVLDRNKFKQKLRNICKEWDINYTIADKIIKAVDRSMYPLIDLRGDQWISVKDHLPNEAGRYLCYYNFEATQNTPDVICENTYLGGGLWQSDNSSVTHWMPMFPEPLEFSFKEEADDC